MKSAKSRKRKLLGATAGLALLALMAGTFAWYQAQDQKLNRVKAEPMNGEVKLKEEWVPVPIEPGTEAQKEVKVKNEAEVPVYVRASYEEVFKYLNSGGDITQSPNPYNPANTALGDDIPVPYLGTPYVDGTYNDYKKVTAKVYLDDAKTTLVSSDVLVYAKGEVTLNGSTDIKHTALDYVIFYQYAPGKYQQMSSAKLNVIDGDTYDRPTNTGAPVTDWTFKATDLAYDVYAGGHSYAIANWAESKLPSDYTAPAGYSLLGGQGRNNTYDFDYRFGVNGFPAAPGVTSPAAADPQVPIGATLNERKESKTVRGAVGPATGDIGIQIRYGTDIVGATALGTPAANTKWIYNPADGWFYYTSPLAMGAETPNLLEAIEFTPAVDKKYDLATFDLIVKMEAISAEKLAMEQVWGMDVTTPSTTKNIADHILGQ